MQLHHLKPAPGSRPPKIIVGRGEGSTLGQTAGKGQKGQTSRSGDSIMTGFEGGQTPLIRRIPKRGFNHPSKICYQPVNLDVIEAKFGAGEMVDGESLYKKGILKNSAVPFKILGGGKLTKSLKFKTGRCSKSAEKAIKQAGGSLEKATTKQG